MICMNTNHVVFLDVFLDVYLDVFHRDGLVWTVLRHGSYGEFM